jgi:hypothetical protein
MTFFALVLGFLAFMALIGVVYALDTWSGGRYGYAPFALLHVVAMLPASAALWTGLALTRGLNLVGAGWSVPADPVWLLGLAAVAASAMGWVILRRTNPWVALFAAPVLLLAAPILVFSMLFRQVALAGETQDPPPPKP